ncbi:GWT1 [Fragilaria crotonensis]|nr:GWT1 [Fragilaria crotonensis]
MASLKEQKEAFVTGHNGTSPGELLVVCLSAPLGVWLYQLLQPKSRAGACALEAVVLLFPMALCQTRLLYPWGLGLLCLFSMVGFVTTLIKTKSFENDDHQVDAPTKTTTKLAFISSYRASVMYLTFVAILAVDFHVFPRRFAKTEVFGYGLMDVGAGSFVVAAGLVSPRARGVPWKNKGAVIRMVPLLALGMVRYLTTKGLDYQEHVSEYGVHWNFFFTLAMLSPVSAITPSRWDVPLGLMAFYQFFLTKKGLQEYVEGAPRSCADSESVLCNVFAANREGILGVVGYLVLFLGAEFLGKVCVWNQDGKRTGRLVMASVALWTLHQIMVVVGIRASRRSTNATFCVWTLAHNITVLTLLCIASVKNEVPPIFNAVNRNGLTVFVVANLLTGLVNLSMNTLAASDHTALLVVFLYLCAVGCFSLMFDYFMTNYVKSKRD